MNKKLLIFLSFIPLLIILFVVPNQINNHHAFRQTQTAITIYYLIKNGFSFAYQTPIMGYPWSFPMEFPIYQIIVAKIVSLTNFQIEITAKLVNLFFYYLSLFSCLELIKNIDIKLKYLFSAVWFTSPTLLMFSSSVSIEFICLFFCLQLIIYYKKIISVRSSRIYLYYLLFILFSLFASLQKITSFIPIFLGIGIHYLYISRKTLFISNISKSIFFIIVSLLIIYINYVWINFSDEIKSQNILTNHLTSKNLSGWNMGSLQQIFSIQFLLKIFGLRILLSGGILIIIFYVLIHLYKLKSKYCFFDSDLSLLLFLSVSPFLIFSNLHWVHDYYSIIFLPFIFMYLHLFLSKNKINLKVLNFINKPIIYLIILFNLSFFTYHFLPKLSPNEFSTEVDKFSQLFKMETNENDVLIGLGLGYSSELPYLSNRKSILISYNDDLTNTINNLDYYAESNLIGGVLLCREYNNNNFIQSLEGLKKTYSLDRIKRGKFCSVLF